MSSIARPVLLLIAGAIVLCALVIPSKVVNASTVYGQQKAEVFAQLGHSGWVNAVAFSPDGRYALSASMDTTLKLWDVASAREIRTFQGHTSVVLSVAFSPDGRRIVSSGRDEAIRIWDTATGQQIRTLTGHGGIIYSVVFSPDGRYVLSGGGGNKNGSPDTTVKLWDIATGAEVRVFTSHKTDVLSVAFSPDGRYVLSGSGRDSTPGDLGKPQRQPMRPNRRVRGIANSEGNVIKLWNTSTGAEIRTLEGHNDYVYSVTFSPDGRYALSGSGDRTLKLWDVATGNEIRTFSGHTGGVSALAFSPDGRYVASGSGRVLFYRDTNADNTVRIWDVSTAREVKRLTGHTLDITSVAFSPDSRYLLSGSRDNEMKLWSVSTGSEIRRFTSFASDITSIGCAPDAGVIASGSTDGKVRIWDTAAAQMLVEIPAHKGGVNSAALSHSRKYILSGGNDGIVRMGDYSGRIVWSSMGHKGVVSAVTLSPDGRYAVSGGRDDILKLWDANNGREVRIFTGHDGDISQVMFSPDGKLIASASGGRPRPRSQQTDHTVRIWDASTGAQVKVFGPNKYQVFSIAFSPDSKHIVAATGGRSLLLAGIDSGNTIKEFTGYESVPCAIAFSPDGRQIASGHHGGNILIWDVNSQKIIKTLKGHSGLIRSLAFSSDGRYIVSGSRDGTTKLWRASDGKEVVQMIGFNDGQWIVVTPEGYYNASPTGDRYLNVRVGNNVYGIDQYRFSFYKPETVEAALRTGNAQNPKPASTSVAPAINVVEPPSLLIKSPEDGKKLSSNQTELNIYVEDKNQTIKTVKVYVNGRLITDGASRGLNVTTSTGQPLKTTPIPEGRRSFDLKLPVALEQGENLVEVVAFNGFADTKKQVRIYTPEDIAISTEQTILPQLWILSIGVNKYADSRIPSLAYAANDAASIVEAFKQQQGQLFSKVNSLVINDTGATRPTYANVLDNLGYLRRAGQHDVVLLFIAGHGINDERGEFYFLPSDAVIEEDGSVRRSRAISWRDIKATLDLPARALVFVDTCHSEGVSGKKTRSIDNDRLVRELQEANAVVLTSSRGRELSQESEKWQHGAFTYALVKGLAGEADLIKDGKITMKELDAYVSETVPQLTNGAQHPITHIPEGYVNFPLVLLKRK